jgi:signal transduction histidine kinase/ABC-type sugar transport system substrate-binding protein/AraC-like DNA-binding protein
MARAFRIGSQIGPYDPFWVQVREAVLQKAQQLGLQLVPIEIAGRPNSLTPEEQISVVEELLSQELDALICWYFPEKMIQQILARGLPVIYLSESEVRHPLFVSPQGLYDAGRMVGEFFAAALQGKGRVLCVGGLTEEEDREDGRTRINGFSDALKEFPEISLRHIPSHWRYDQAFPEIEAALKPVPSPIDAVFGLSDPIALAARDALRAAGRMGKETLIAGVNGDPLALAALAEGSLSATVETSTVAFGNQAVELAHRAARKETLPAHFSYQPRLITSDNLTEVALQKLLAIADLPTRLVGVNRQLEQNRLKQMETSTAINRRVGGVLERRRLAHEIADLIRVNYGYDHVRLYMWSREESAFILERGISAADPEGKTVVPLEQSGILGEALRRNESIFIPDTRFSQRFPPDSDWPETLSRVVLPIRLGDTILGILDLHSQHHTVHLRQELIGLQSLVDQLGIAIRNAESYEDAVRARAAAEKADQLKTRLLANVGHELRAPLNVILGYSQSALSRPNPYGIELPDGMRRDIGYIFRSCEHLTRLINDLLDLSRAEIGQLDLFPEMIPTRAFLEEAFHSMADTSAGDIRWKLLLPDRLPMIQADPIRLRQILFNLLSNARKFTACGEIGLGAEIDPPHLHLWVQDTGPGIPVELQERIFEPFSAVERSERRSEGIGLGLSITRRLVALHGGTMRLESQPGKGSVFHVYLPLPSLSGKFTAPVTGILEPVLLVLTAGREPSQTVAKLAAQSNLPIRLVGSIQTLETALQETAHGILVWDMVQARPEEWDLVERVRSHPRLCQLPFIVYREKIGRGVEITEMLVKPVAAKTLMEAVTALRPFHGTGPILIVDDEPETRDFYRRVAQDAFPGYRVITAENGTAALDSMRTDIPSAVVLDLIMPGVDGFMVLEKMRAQSETRHIPVLVMSGKLLSIEDIRRLDYARVTFQSKELLSTDEAVELLRKILGPGEPLPKATSILVKAAIAYLHQNYTLHVTRQEIARAVGVSSNYLSRIFHQEVGLSTWDCLNRIRILKAREILENSPDPITMVATQVGFEDSAYFSRIFKKHTGQSPQAYRQTVK